LASGEILDDAEGVRVGQVLSEDKQAGYVFSFQQWPAIVPVKDQLSQPREALTQGSQQSENLGVWRIQNEYRWQLQVDRFRIICVRCGAEL
jgi:hypothetical protein